jgi:hypothetical protein
LWVKLSILAFFHWNIPSETDAIGYVLVRCVSNMLTVNGRRLNGIQIERTLRDKTKLRKDTLDEFDKVLTTGSAEWRNLLTQCVEIDAETAKWAIIQQIYNHKVEDQAGEALVTYIRKAAFLRTIISRLARRIEEGNLKHSIYLALAEELRAKEHSLIEVEHLINGLNLTNLWFDNIDEDQG